jgi:hypothetical protein
MIKLYQLLSCWPILSLHPSSAPAPADPCANLWKRTEDIPFPPWDKVDVATLLSKPEQMYLRNYLNAASDQSFGTWVTDYLGAEYIWC